MMDAYSKQMEKTMQGFRTQLNSLYRGRPYTKSVPFNLTFVDASVRVLWAPQNSYFEFNRMYIQSDTALIDMNIVDTVAEAVFGMVIPSTSEYTLVDFGGVGYRSLNYANAICGIVDPSGTSGATIKGFILGWEVTKEGDYR